MSDIPMSYAQFENSPSVLREYMIGHLEGKMLTIVESLGLKPKQEQAVKSIVRREIWNWYENNPKIIPHEFVEEFEKSFEEIWIKQDNVNTSSR